MEKTPEITLRAQMCFVTTKPEELERILDHHMEYLIDMDDNRDLIQTVHSVKSYDVKSKHDVPKLQMLAALLSDIIGETEPTDEELDDDDDAIALYDELHNLKEALKNCGYDV